MYIITFLQDNTSSKNINYLAKVEEKMDHNTYKTKFKIMDDEDIKIVKSKDFLELPIILKPKEIEDLINEDPSIELIIDCSDFGELPEYNTHIESCVKI